MNKIKEKKLNSIKLQIDEIFHFAQSKIETETKNTSTDKAFAFIIINIVNIKKELVEIQKTLNNHKIILDSILAKLS